VDQNDLQHHIDKRFDSLDSRLERVEEKLDDHLSRLAHAEASIEWIRGHAKVVTIVILSVAGFLASLWAGIASS